MRPPLPANPQRPARRAALYACLALWSLVAPAPAGAAPVRRAATDDSLTGDERRLVLGLVQRGMPELVEHILEDRPPQCRIHVARAYIRAGQQETDGLARDRFYKAAGDEYERLLKLEEKKNWLKGLGRRLDAAQWRVEWADLILRRLCADDLDQYEITSGLDFDRGRLKSLLGRADKLYREAETRLEDLDLERRTDEDEFLLLGISEQISTAIEQQQLNGAWTRLYLGLIEKEDTGLRTGHLEAAMRTFWMMTEQASDDRLRENGRLGLGIARRELERFDEALRDLERVENSTQPLALTARAAYEAARSLLAARRYDAARQALDRLGNLPTARLSAADSGAVFYIRLAPLVRAYSYMHASQQEGLSSQDRDALRQEAQDAFAELAARGGAWPRMTQVYLDALAGRHRDVEQLTPVELALAAGQWMAEKDYERASRAWQLILDRQDASQMHAEARFNLGVCRFQIRDVRTAAELFLTGARRSPPDEIAERTYEYAYRCWRQLAAESKDREDLLQLAEAAELLSTRLPRHRDTAEASWIAALAVEEAGEYQRAIGLYGRVPAASPNYWNARRNLARCRQRLYETLPEGASITTRHNAATDCVDAWLKFADDLEAAGGNGTDAAAGATGRKSAPSAEERGAWIEEARIVAASILASDDLRDYPRCIRVLGSVRRSGRALGLHIRSLQGMGDIRGATRVLEEYLQQSGGEEAGGVLVSLAAEMELEVHRLSRMGRDIEARRMASETIPTMRHLLKWMQDQQRPEEDRRVVKFSLAKLLDRSDQSKEAMQLLDELMADAPNNGSYVRTAALMYESIAESPRAVDRTGVLNKAEALWARLLEDAFLRESSPNEYWEARYHWLKHQLRHNRAKEVLSGIQAEEAWFPDMGGITWRGRFRALAEEARQAVERGT